MKNLSETSIISCFSHNLRVIRKRNRLTQESFSDVLKIKRATLAAYEEMRSFPPAHTLLAISEQYKIDINTLISDKIQDHE